MSSGFQRQGFRISQAKVPGFSIPDYLTWDEPKRTFVSLGTGHYLSPRGGGSHKQKFHESKRTFVSLGTGHYLSPGVEGGGGEFSRSRL